MAPSSDLAKNFSTSFCRSALRCNLAEKNGLTFTHRSRAHSAMPLLHNARTLLLGPFFWAWNLLRPFQLSFLSSLSFSVSLSNMQHDRFLQVSSPRSKMADLHSFVQQSIQSSRERSRFCTSGGF